MYMYNMKSISGVRGWTVIAPDALESQDIYDLFGNKKEEKKVTLKSFMPMAFAKNKDCQIMNNGEFKLPVGGAVPGPNTILMKIAICIQPITNLTSQLSYSSMELTVLSFFGSR